MDRYVVERNLPNAGELSEDELHAMSAKSNAVLESLGDDVRWVESHVTADKLYCVYDATDPRLIEQHAERGGFPCDRISPVHSTISPATGGGTTSPDEPSRRGNA